MGHMDRYVIREDVTFENASESATRMLAGAEAPAALERMGIEPPGAHRWLPCGSALERAIVRRCSWGHVPVYQISLPGEDVGRLEKAWAPEGIDPVAAEAWEALRIESGWPQFPIDFTADNLPHEVGRHTTAVSFDKGCYLGQEPIARIDALGHPNWCLRGLKWEQSPPAPGASVEREGKVVARIGSGAYCPLLEAWISFALVRRGHDSRGAVIEGATIDGEGCRPEVVELPPSGG